MVNETLEMRRARLKSPRAAAVAGIIFAVLFTIAIALIRTSIPEPNASETSPAWLEANATTISLALTLVPFAGIAFLWFMGVVRERIGALEDQFFATVFFGSGLLFLAMIFASAAVAGGMIAMYGSTRVNAVELEVIRFGRSITYTVTNVYAIRMAAVFMLSLGTIWVRTRVMPRLFVFLTYGFALLMLVAVNFSVWLILVFPAWVLVISAYILILSFRKDQIRSEAALGAADK